MKVSLWVPPQSDGHKEPPTALVGWIPAAVHFSSGDLQEDEGCMRRSEEVSEEGNLVVDPVCLMKGRITTKE